MQLFRNARRRSSFAFAVSDLVVLLAGVCVLGLLLMSGLAHGNVDVRTATCLGNLRTLGRAWALYAEDNGGLLVNNFIIPEVQNTAAQKTYRTWANNIMDWGRSADNTNLALMATGRLAPYLEVGPGVFKCPADTYRSPQQVQLGWPGRVRSYSMNGFMGGTTASQNASDSKGLNPFYPNYRQFRQTSGIPNPSGILLFLDEHPDSINDAYYFVTLGPASTWGDIPAAYHDGGNNFAFADGHAENHAWLAPTNIPLVRYSYSSPVLRGAGKDDYAWVATRQTVPATALTVSRTASASPELRIVWSQIAAPHALQRSGDPNSGEWTKVSTLPEKSLGQWSTVLRADDAQGYFRLGPP